MNGERRDSTMEVLLEEVDEATSGAPRTSPASPGPHPERALDRALDDLLDGSPSPSTNRKETSHARAPGSLAPSVPPPPRAGRAPKPPVPRPFSARTRGAVVTMPTRAAGTVANDPTAAPKAAPVGERDAMPAEAFLEEAIRRSLAAPEPTRRARALLDAAVVAEENLRDVSRAIDLHRRALACAPNSKAVLRSLRRLLLAVDARQDALPVIDAEARLVSDPRERAALLVLKAALLEDGLGRAGEARAAYLQAHELDRRNTIALRALLRSDWDGVQDAERARLLERCAMAIEADPALRAELCVRRGRALERDQRPEAAIEAYREALSLDGRCLSALEALKRLLPASPADRSVPRTGTSSGAVATEQRARLRLEILAREISIEQDPARKARLQLRYADVAGRELGRHDVAVEALEAALTEAPDALQEEVLAALVEAHERADDPAALASVLSRWADRTDDPTTRIALLSRLAEAYARGGEATRPDAVAALERALALDPTHVPTLQSLGKLLRESKAWARLVQMHLAEAAATRDPTRRAAAHARVADILERELGAPDEAIAHHLRALTAVPSHAPSFHALARLYRERGMHRELLELHRRTLETATDLGHRVALLFAIGAIHEDLLGEPHRAIESYEAVLALEPTSRVALAALSRAGERAGRPDVVVRALDRDAELETETSRKLALLHRAGELLATFEPEGAIARFRKVLDLDPTHRPALSSLGRLHHDLGQWDDLADVLRRELDLTEGASAKALVAARIAEIAENRLGRPDEALTFTRRAFELDPTNAAVARSLERRLRARHATSDLRALFETELDALEAQGEPRGEPKAAWGARRARAAMALGDLHERTSSDPERALAAYRRAVVDGALRPEALDACVRLLVRLGKVAELVDLLEDEAQRAQGERAAALHCEAARAAFEGLGDRGRAVRLYEAALSEDPTSVAAWTGLEDVYRASSDLDAARDGLARALAGQAQVLRDPNARAAALFELGRLQRRLDGRPDDAEMRASFETMAKLTPRDPVALDTLAALATATADIALRERVERVLSDVTSDASARAVHLAFLGRRALERGEPEALDWLKAASALEPGSLLIARDLVRAAEAHGTASDLEAALRHGADLEPSAAARASLLYRAAQLAERTDPERAVADLEEALECAPEREDVAEALMRLLVASGRAERAIERLRKAAASTRVLGHHARIAWIQAEVLHDAPAATATLARAAQRLGETPALVALQVDYAEADGQWAEAVARCERLAQLTEDDVGRGQALLRAGLLALRRLHDARGAEPKLREALELTGDVQALAALAEASFLDGRMTQAWELAVEWAERSETDAGIAWTMAMRAARAMGDRDRTLRAAVAAVRREGSGGPARQAFAEWVAQASADDRHPRLLALVQALREHTRDYPADPGSFLDLAHVLHHELSRPADAADALLEGARRHPHDPALRRELVRRLVDAGRDHEAIALAERRVGDAPLSAEAWTDLALALSRSERRAWTAAPLALLGVDGRPPAPPVRIAALAPEVVLSLADLTPEAPLVGILHALSETLPRLYPADLEGYGAGPRDRLAPRGGHPLRTIFDRVANVFGAPPFDLFVHRVRGRSVALEFADPIDVLVPAWVSDLPEAGQIFVAARTLALVSARLAVVDKLTSRELEILVASAVRLVAPGFGAGLTSEEVLDDQSRRIARLLSRRARRTLDEFAPRYASEPERDYSGLTARIQRAAARAALLVADDLERSLDALRRLERDSQGLDIPTFLRGSSLGQDLLRFYASEAALELRRRHGAPL